MHWRKKNPERAREVDRRWRENNRDKLREYQRRWKERNPGLARERARAWYAANKEKASRRERERFAALRDRVYRAYGGWICACCGEDRKTMLMLDHVNNDGAEHRRSINNGKDHGGGRKTFLWIRDNGFPPGFQVLCANCNWSKAQNDGICEHVSERSEASLEGVDRKPGRSAELPGNGDEDMVRPNGKPLAAHEGRSEIGDLR